MLQTGVWMATTAAGLTRELKKRFPERTVYKAKSDEDVRRYTTVMSWKSNSDDRCIAHMFFSPPSTIEQTQ